MEEEDGHLPLSHKVLGGGCDSNFSGCEVFIPASKPETCAVLLSKEEGVLLIASSGH